MSTAGGSTVAGLTGSSPPAVIWGRRAALGALALVVLADLTSALGVHTGSRTATGDGYRLTLEYPAIARPGWDTPWRVTVQHPGGFAAPIRLALTGDYLSIFETQGFHPTPAAETRDANRLIMTFDPPSGDTFVLDYDAYIQPASQRGRSGELSLIAGGRPVAEVGFTTFLWP